MSFFTVEPEASGAPDGEKSGKAVSCLFDSWLGDDLVRAYPAVLVTTPVREALLDLRQPTGFEIARARIRTSGFFRQQHPESGCRRSGRSAYTASRVATTWGSRRPACSSSRTASSTC
jgi:hypothetical protein